MRPYTPGESFFNIIQTAIPDFVEAEYPLFIEFVQSYLHFLEQHRTLGTKLVYPEYGTAANGTVQVTTQLGGPFYEARKFLEYRDADSTLDEFKSHFMQMFAKNFPSFAYIPTNTFINTLRQFYQSKGTVDSIQWLFRSIFNEHADVYFPRVDILKASDGTWSAPITLKVSSPTNGHPNKDVGAFYIGQRIQTATGSAQVEAVTTTVVGQAFNQNITVNELRLKFDSIIGTFAPGQDLFNLDSDTIVHTTVLPVVTALVVESGGSNYAVGDIISFSEGPSGGYGYNAFGLVSLISNSAINGVTVLNGGDGFIIGEPVLFVSTSGHGATAIVSNIVYGDILLEDGTGYFLLEHQTPDGTDFITLEDQNMLILELIIDPFVNAISNVIIESTDYGFDSGVTQLNGVGFDSEIEFALAAVDEKPFMHPWVFTNDLETTASLANAAAQFTYVTNTFFSNGATIFSLVNPTDVTSNDSTANVVANIIVAHDNEGGANGTLYLDGFTGFNKFSTNMLVKENGNGVLQLGTITTNGTPNVVGSNTTFTTVLKPNTHIRFTDGTQAVVRTIVNNTFLTTYANVEVTLVTNNYSIIPVGTITSIVFQSQRYYGKIKTVKLLTNGVHYDTPPAVFADSVSARAQELFHLEPDPITPVDPQSANNVVVSSADQIHVFATPNLKVQQAAGQIQKVKIIDSGVNYQDANATIATATHTPPRTGDPATFQTITGAVTHKPGQYTTSRGFLSADKFLQDSTFYNDYTYVIRVAESFDRYRDILLKLIHPAGFQPLGRFVDVIDAPFTVVEASMEERERLLLPLDSLISSPEWGNGVFMPATIGDLQLVYDGGIDI